jgi:hypothetical protein
VRTAECADLRSWVASDTMGGAIPPIVDRPYDTANR